MVRTLSALSIALATTACSSSYVPARSPRIATVWRGGYPSYYRDGVEYPSGFLLDGVEDAVHGNPRAEEEARTAHGLMIGGLVCELGGAAALGGGIAVAATNHPGDSGNDVAIGLLIGSVVASLAGAILTANAFPHAYDAVNIYNDGVNATPSGANNYARPRSEEAPAPPLTR
jgi:hypothetical protein